MAMQPICNLTLAALLALGASASLWAQDEQGSRRGNGEGRSFEGRGEGARQGRQGAENRAPRDEGQPVARRNRNDGDQDSSPPRTQTPAVPLPAAVEHSWLDEIAELEVQTTLLEKRDDLASRRIDSQIRLKQKRTELDALERESTDEMLAYLPQVVSVIGSKGKYQCQLFFPSGRTSYARAGDTIAPGVRVKSISPSGVEVDVLMGERRQVPLGFVSLAERRGEAEGAGKGENSNVTPGEFFRNIFGPRQPGAAGGAPARPAAAAPAGARAAGARGAGNGGN
ncbi:hypothetical protein AXE65_06415 [Ventosimonas gracilis]|uniref:Type IV pilus biogenesis protein PilP n=1 Tax=Ventosimonas gracilis TaxID=1680762 RepID=A0A139SLD8_9GAMM|nr:type IV pilus biogenesis protein PilP [Ventosimonas gracilis]KXU35365.1 hypothetical protein AXE65_06415 [Ventosimonas gracilis]